MLDARLQARLAQNYTDAAVGYANASMAAFSAMTDRSMAFWMPAVAPPRTRPQPAGRRDHLSWFNGGQPASSPAASGSDMFNPWSAFNMWSSAVSSAMQPRVTAPSMMAMAMSFSPFAAWWGGALRAPNFAWPMAYSMIAHGVPESVAWPTAEANAAVMDAANVVAQQVEHAFASYQSANGYATSHIWPSKSTTLAMTALAPFAALWSFGGTSTPGLY